MATKSNIRSIRMSDEVLKYIEDQVGENFTQKFEAMVLRCMWELPAKEEELKKLEEQIRQKRKQLYDMTAQAGKLSTTINQITDRARILEQTIAREIHSWEV